MIKKVICIIGIIALSSCGSKKSKCIDSLMEEGMTYEQAKEECEDAMLDGVRR